MVKSVKAVVDARKQSVQKIPMDQKVEDAIRFFAKTGCKAAVVVDENRALCGILTEHDLVKYCGENGKVDSNDKVEDVMSLDLVVVTEDSQVKDAATLMVDNNVHYLPVVNEPGHLMGFVSMMDIMVSFLDD